VNAALFPPLLQYVVVWMFLLQ